MKIFILFILLFAIGMLNSFAQNSSKYWIQFTNKKNSPYSITSPQNFLSQRAIDRRTRQNIPVTLQDLPINPAYIDSIISTGAIIVNRSKWLNAVTIEVNDLAFLDAARSFSFVKNVSAVKMLRAEKKEDLRQDTEKFGSVGPLECLSCGSYQRSLNYGASFNQINMLSGDYLHYQGFQGQGMVIAVLDAGFYKVDSLPAFDSLRTNNQILGTYDFVQGNTSVYEDHNHGMNVLSTMGGYLDGQIIGTAPKASYWLLRSEDAAFEYLAEEDNWVAAAEFADSVGADIINSSLGYTTFDDPLENHTYNDMNGNTTIITKGANIAASKGILVVNSAGNSGSSSWNYIGAPADGDSVLAIGAVDVNSQHASFSSKGPSFDGRVKPNVAAQGQATIVASTSGGIQAGNGTSFSSPIMAGMAACLWQAHPSLTNMQIFNIILESAHLYSNPDTLLGFGIPDFALANLIASGVDIKTLDKEQFKDAFPNPFNNSFEFTFFSPVEQEIMVEIIDMTGRMIYKENKTIRKNDYYRLAMNGAGLSGGIYILNVTTAFNRYTQKLIKE